MNERRINTCKQTPKSISHKMEHAFILSECRKHKTPIKSKSVFCDKFFNARNIYHVTCMCRWWLQACKPSNIVIDLGSCIKRKFIRRSISGIKPFWKCKWNGIQLCAIFQVLICFSILFSFAFQMSNVYLRTTRPRHQNEIESSRLTRAMLIKYKTSR